MKSDLTPEEFSRLADLVNGECTADESEATQRWLSEHPEQQHVVEALKKVQWAFSPDHRRLLPVNAQQAVLGALSSVADRETNQSGVNSSLYANRLANTGAQPHSHQTRSFTEPSASNDFDSRFTQVPQGSAAEKPSLFRRYAPPISGLFAAIALTVIAWNVTNTRDAGVQEGRVSRYATSNGKQATVTLPDGTEVVLNAASMLEVPADYDRGNRNVRLTGEALFTVTHHGKSPFTVDAGASRTRVLGTQFTVRYYPEDPDAVVAVRDGKVSVQSTTITANQQISVSSTGVAGAVEQANPMHFGIAAGLLVIDNLSLETAIPQLNRWFDADVRIGDEQVARDITIAGSFQQGSVADLAGLLEKTFGVRVVRDGRTLTIYP